VVALASISPDLRNERTALWSSRKSGVFGAVLFVATAALAQEAPTDAQIRDAIIKESIASYMATGHPCACPYNVARNGSSCGARSAYSRPGGAAPLCYPPDISDQMVAAWRRSHTE
jgi:hypothetical protein